MKGTRLLFTALLGLELAACSTANSGFRRPDLSKITSEMTKQEVIAVLGPPDSIKINGDFEYLQYGYDSPWDGRMGWAEIYYVNLFNGKVDAYGRSLDGTPIELANVNDDAVSPILLQPQSEAGNALSTEQFQSSTNENAYVVEQNLQAAGMVTIRGRVERVTAKDITLVADTESHPKIVCQFPQLPRAYGQPFSYATPVEASSLRRDDFVIVAARFRKYLFPSKSTALFEDCHIVQIVPAAQAARAQASAPRVGATPQVPTGASQSSPPAGYYQCYVLQVLSGGNSCKLGDLQLDGQGNYSSTAGAGGTYVSDPAVGVVSFSGGILNGRMALAKISNKGTFMLRMRLSGGLPSPRQTFGTYTFEHRSSGHRERW